MTGSNELVGFGDNVVSKDSNGCGTVASYLVEFLRGGLDEFCAHFVAKRFVVGFAEVDSFCNSYAIMGNSWCAVGLFNNDIASFWTESDLYGIIESFGATENFLACLSIIENFFCHLNINSFLLICEQFLYSYSERATWRLSLQGHLLTRSLAAYVLHKNIKLLTCEPNCIL